MNPATRIEIYNDHGYYIGSVTESVLNEQMPYIVYYTEHCSVWSSKLIGTTIATTTRMKKEDF